MLINISKYFSKAQSINVIKRASQNKTFIHPREDHDDEYLVREQTQKTNQNP